MGVSVAYACGGLLSVRFCRGENSEQSAGGGADEFQVVGGEELLAGGGVGLGLLGGLGAGDGDGNGRVGDHELEGGLGEGSARTIQAAELFHDGQALEEGVAAWCGVPALAHGIGELGLGGELAGAEALGQRTADLLALQVAGRWPRSTLGCRWVSIGGNRACRTALVRWAGGWRWGLRQNIAAR